MLEKGKKKDEEKNREKNQMGINKAHLEKNYSLFLFIRLQIQNGLEHHSEMNSMKGMSI